MLWLGRRARSPLGYQEDTEGLGLLPRRQELAGSLQTCWPWLLQEGGLFRGSTKGAGPQPGVALGWRDICQAGAGKNCSFFPSPGEDESDASILHTLRIEEFLCLP